MDSLVAYTSIISFYFLVEKMSICICVYYCKNCIKLELEISLDNMVVYIFVIVNTVMSCESQIIGMIVMFSTGGHCKYCNKLCFKSSYVVCFVGYKRHRTSMAVFPQGGWVYNNPWLIFHVNKIRPRSWGTYSKLNSGENIIMGITCD